MPSAIALLVAEGLLARLRVVCWTQCTDLLGTPDDVDALCGWTNPPRVLAKLLRAAGLLGVESGELFCPSAIREAPEYVKKRWGRRNPASYRAAIQRAKKAQADPVPATEDEADTPDEVDLFGQRIIHANDKATAGFQAVVSVWFAIYERRYGRRYAFKAKDGAIIKKALGSGASHEDLCAALERYLACTEPFYAGHDLSGFIGKLNRWLATPAPARGKPGELIEHIPLSPIVVGRGPQGPPGARAQRAVVG
ncbi:MAG: hypothetical protein IT443_11950 [Phycisphaeraceae bacterium]|nr:hypothetical protein [Phycisphaeraceae bacterium]